MTMQNMDWDKVLSGAVGEKDNYELAHDAVVAARKVQEIMDKEWPLPATMSTEEKMALQQVRQSLVMSLSVQIINSERQHGPRCPEHEEVPKCVECDRPIQPTTSFTMPFPPPPGHEDHGHVATFGFRIGPDGQVTPMGVPQQGPPDPEVEKCKAHAPSILARRAVYNDCKWDYREHLEFLGFNPDSKTLAEKNGWFRRLVRFLTRET